MAIPGMNFYVTGPDRKDFDTKAEAYAFYLAHPEYKFLGQFVADEPREGPYGIVIRGHHGEVLERR